MFQFSIFNKKIKIMPRPVQYNTKVKLVEMPKGYSGEGFLQPR